MTSHPENKILYERIKAKVYQMYEKPSAYRSGMLVKLYKAAGGTYSGNRTDNQDGTKKNGRPTGRNRIQK